jgi:hypothetical protein
VLYYSPLTQTSMSKDLVSKYLAGILKSVTLYTKQSSSIWEWLTNQNLIQEEIKRRLNSGNACYHLVHNLLSSHLMSKSLKIRIYKTILPLVLYGCETRSLTLRKDHRLKAFDNRVLTNIWTEDWWSDEGVEKTAWGAYDMYSLPRTIGIIKSRRMKWMGQVAWIGEKRNA